MLTKEAQRSLVGRVAVGDACIRAAYGGDVVDEDRETYAKDAIADILTVLFGPAGTYREERDGNGRMIGTDNDEACDNARRFLDHALECYFGDAEDYVEAPAFEVIGAAVVGVFTPTPDMADAWKRFTEGGEVTQDELRELDDQRTTWALEQ